MDQSLNITNILNNISPKKEEKLNVEKFSNNMENFMDKTVVNIYARKWSKLEVKLKKKKINEFVIEKSEEHNFSLDKQKELLDCLISKLMQNKLNKINEIKYDEKTQKIIEIKKLVLKEDSFTF